MFFRKQSLDAITFLTEGAIYFILKSNNRYKIKTFYSERKATRALAKLLDISSENADKIIANKVYSENWGRSYSASFLKNYVEKGIPMGYWNLNYFRRESSKL